MKKKFLGKPQTLALHPGIVWLGCALISVCHLQGSFLGCLWSTALLRFDLRSIPSVPKIRSQTLHLAQKPGVSSTNLLLMKGRTGTTSLAPQEGRMNRSWSFLFPTTALHTPFLHVFQLGSCTSRNALQICEDVCRYNVASSLRARIKHFVQLWLCSNGRTSARGAARAFWNEAKKQIWFSPLNL